MKIADEYKKFDTNFTVMPAHCNYDNIIFGGKAMAELDLCAASLVRRIVGTYLSGRNVKGVTHKSEFTMHCAPIPGDIVFMTASLAGIGTNSFVINVEATREERETMKRERFADSKFVFVCREVLHDDNGTKRVIFPPHKLEL